MFKTYAFIILLLCAKWMHAQQQLALSGMPDLWHAHTLNPALAPQQHRLTIGLPAVGIHAAHSGDVSYNDILKKQDGRNILDFASLINALEDRNTLSLDQRIETISVGFQTGSRTTLMAGHAWRTSASVEYPKSLPALLWNGNAQYIGQEVDIALKTTAFDWHEFSLGAAQRVGGLTFGARLKYLAGVSAIRTNDDAAQALVYTDPDIYQLRLRSDYGFYSSGIISSIDTSNLGFKISTGPLNGRAAADSRGIALDLGIRAKVGERLTLHAALLDVGGQIKWKQGKYFHSEGEYLYEGAVIPGADIVNGAGDLDFSSRLDTLNDIFRFKESAGAFTTRLPMQINAGALWAPGKRWQLGASVYFMNRAGKDVQALGLSARWLPLKWLSAGLVYSLTNRSAANLGMSLSLTPGPVEWYFVSDNLLSAFRPYASPAVNFRIGAALKIGRISGT